MFVAPGVPRPHYEKVLQGIGRLAPAEYEDRRQLADLSFLLQGITFTVYSDGRGTERLFPFDLMPRVLPRAECYFFALCRQDIPWAFPWDQFTCD